MSSSPSSLDSALHTSLQAVHAELRAQVAEARKLAAHPSDAGARVEASTVNAFFASVWPRYMAAKQALVGRLEGRDGAVDAVLAEVRRSLEEQRVLVERVVALTTPAAAQSSAWTELAAVTATLERRLDEGLGDEERLVHPTLGRLLDEAAQGELASAFRLAAAG